MSSASLKILNRLYENCFSLSSFINMFVYDPDHCLSHPCAPDYMDFLGKIFVTFPPKVIGHFPQKLHCIPEQRDKFGPNFVDFYACNQHRFNSVIFESEVFLQLTQDSRIALEEPLSSMFYIEHWNSLYAHVGQAWLFFIFQRCSVYISFPNNCLLQVVGVKAIDDKYVVEKRKLDAEDQTLNKRLKSSENTVPAVTFHGAKLTLSLETLLYSKQLIPRFPAEHVEKARCSEPDAAHKLIEEIFQNNKVPLKEASGKNYELPDSIITLFLQENAILTNAMHKFLTNHGRTHYLELFQAHCPFDSQAEPNVENYCSSDQVRSFMAAVIHHVIPIQLFGSKHNKCKMQTFCNTFICASKGDRLSLEHLMHGMQIQNCAWIPDEFAENHRKIAFALMMNWLFSTFLMDVVSGYFIITDIQGQKKRLFFYPKLVWKKIQASFMQQLVKNGILKHEALNAYEKSKLHTLLGKHACLAGARFFPKKSSMRLILNCKHSKSQLINLNDYLCTLNLIAKCNDLRGYSIVSPSQFHQTWQHFVNANRTGGTLVFPMPLHFVKLDIQDCFLSVKYNILEQALRSMCRVAEDSGFGEVDVHYYFTYGTVNDQLVHDYKRVASSKGRGLLESLMNAGHFNKVLVCLNRHTRISVPEMSTNLMMHVSNIYVKQGGDYYRMMQGLGQGNLLSPVLSGLYFAHMENERLLQFAIGDLERHLLVRCVDDYFHVNTVKEKAQEFLSLMHPGMPEYNCNTSCKKVEANFDVEANLTNSTHTCARKKELISWLGMLFNTKTGEITCDFSHYAGQSMAHNMTLDASLGKEGLSRKLVFLIAPENQPILFNAKVNSKKTIIKNVYKFCLLNAFRLHSLSKKLSKSEGADKHPDFYYELIVTCIRRIVNSLGKLKRRGIISYPLRCLVTKWICLQAFESKLNCHSMKYHQVLKRLRNTNAEFSLKIRENVIRYLKRAIGCKLPETFKRILV